MIPLTRFFLEELLKALKFSDVFIQMIMEWVTSCSFSFMINGSLVGFFKGKKRS